jgi:hypothetical protein
MANLRSRQQRLVYLITYSRADPQKVQSREAFGAIIVNAFEQLCVARVEYWVVSEEKHHDNEETSEFPTHFHMAVKLTTQARWSRVRSHLQSTFNIQVNFSSNHNTYYSAFKYVTKEDANFVVSSCHPDLKDTPRTEKAIAAKKAAGKATGRKLAKKKRERYSTFDVVEIIREHGIKSRLELISLAVKQKEVGKTVLAEFIANRGFKVVEEALALALEFQEAPAKLARLQKTRVDVLREAYNGLCVADCSGKWLECALGLLSQNEISLSTFCAAVYNALHLGRAKYRNIYIHGPANTGKTFILTQLKLIFKCFTNPATGSFAWLGVEEAEVIVLNDFRWHPSIIAWGDLLQLLEGDTVHLSAPKTFNRKDIEFTKETPVFATADAPLILVKDGFLDHANTEMMHVRWLFFNFHKQIPQDEQVRQPPCPSCFARLIIDYKDI